MIGITTSCSLNLKIARGSDSNTDVSSTYVLVPMEALGGLAAEVFAVETDALVVDLGT
jgi:hypothetical protein